LLKTLACKCHQVEAHVLRTLAGKGHRVKAPILLEALTDKC